MKRLLSSSIRRYTPRPSRSHWKTVNDDLFDLSQEEKYLRQMGHTFFKDEIDEQAHEIDRTDSFPELR